MKGFTSDKTFKSIFLSYAIVLIIPLILGVIISGVIAKTVYREIVELGTYSARLTQSKLDNALGGVLSTASNLAGNDKLRRTIFFDDVILTDPAATILINSMSKEVYSISNDLIDNICIYYNVSDSVISYDGRIVGSSVPWYLKKEFNLTGADIMSYVLDYPSGNILLCNTNDSPTLVAIFPVYGKNSYKTGGAVCIKIDKEKLLSSIEDYEFGDGKIIINDGVQYLASSGESGFNFLKFKSRLSDTMYTVDWASSFKGLKYSLYIPTKAFFDSFNKAILITVMYTLFCLISGTAIILIISYKRYRLLRSFMKLTSTTTPRDAINSIERTLKQATQYKLRYGNYQTKFNQLKRERQLNLLFAYIPYSDHAAFSLNEYEITFPYKLYTVVVLDTVLDYSGLFFGDEKNLSEDDLYMHATTILRAVYEELFSTFAKAYITTTLDCRVCIINFDVDNGRIDSTLREAAEFCKTNFGIELLCCRGQTVTSIDRIKESLKSAMNDAFLLTYGDIPSAKSNTISQKIKNYIDDHYSDKNLDISMIAGSLELSPSYISRIFKQATGHTILEYISLCRITAAKQFLRETNKSIRAISEAVGYSSIRTFTRTMQRLVEMSPSEYRSLSNSNGINCPAEHMQAALSNE